MTGYALSPTLVHELKAVPPRAVVLAPVELSYRILAAAPVYVVAAPVAHVADTKANRPYQRVRDVRHWLATGDPAIARKYGATWEVEAGTSTLSLCEGPDRDDVLPAVGRRRRAAAAQVRDAISRRSGSRRTSSPRTIRSGSTATTTSSRRRSAWVHRARYIGPVGRKPAEELHGTTGLDRVTRQASLFRRRLLVPDENVGWNLTAIPAAIRIVRQEGIDVVLTTSPPSSVHLVGRSGQARDRGEVGRRSPGLDGRPSAPGRRAADRPREGAGRAADRAPRRAPRGRDRRRCRGDRGPRCAAQPARLRRARSRTAADFDDFAGLEYRRGERFRITHAGSFFGKRDPRPFLTALARVEASIAALRRRLPRE